jgi:hypothetical protein
MEDDECLDYCELGFLTITASYRAPKKDRITRQRATIGQPSVIENSAGHRACSRGRTAASVSSSRRF